MELKKKYGLITAICMVVGIVIGSGVFFKAQTILTQTQGNMPLGILAWGIGGAIMLICSLAFATMATRYEKVNGIVDYAEATVGKGYAYFIGWFMTTIYYPTLTSVLAWLSARYTLTFLVSVNPSIGIDPTAGPECLALTMFFLCCAYVVNALSPKLAGKLQVSTTVVKLIPLGLMAIVGTIYGLANGMTQQNFMQAATVEVAAGAANPLFAGVVATSFAYEGWIIATSINAELKDAKRNLPRALVIGALIVVAVYIAYYVGVAGGASNQQLIDQGATVAYTNIFGNVFGNFLNLLIAISCMGTLNGLMLGCCRGMYSLAARDQGPKPKVFKQIDPTTNMPNNSAVIGLLFCGFWGLYFYFANLTSTPGTWVGRFQFDSSELPIVTIYALYLPIFLLFICKAKDQGVIRRFVIPILAMIGSVFMVIACVFAHGMGNVYYLIFFAVFMIVGALFYKTQKEKKIYHHRH